MFNNDIISKWLKKKSWSLYKHQKEVLRISHENEKSLIIYKTETTN